MSLQETTSPFVLGIDLGTSNSSAAIYLKGKSHTILIDGDMTVPSVVQFKKKKSDAMLVGRAARRQVLISPDEVFSSVKRLMRNDDWKNDDELVKKFTLLDKDGNDVQITPTNVAAEILKKLIETVQSQDEIDLKGTIRRAVICVPANTTDEYRINVYKAAALAGLGEIDENGNVVLDENGFPNGVFVLEEPTAAAKAYSHEQEIFSTEKEQTILVYDLGGGTFDVTILKMDSKTNLKRPKLTVKATKGVAKLGGDDFDKALMDICAEEFKKNSGIDIFDLKSDQRATPAKALKTAQQKLKEASEQCKTAFAGGSKKEEINLPTLLVDGDGGSHDLVIEIKKSDFIERIKPLLDETKKCVLDSLKEANLTLDDINRIVLAGGSTKADWVVEAIKSLYPSEEEKDPYMAANVDLIVSQGAAIHGSSKRSMEPVPSSDIVETEDEPILSHHLGIATENEAFSLILGKGLPLTDDQPIQSATNIYGNQENLDTLQISVWKTQKTIDFEDDSNKTGPIGEHSVREKDAQNVNIFECIGDFFLKGIPKAPRGTEKIEVMMEINKDNLLKVSAKVMSKGTTGEIKLEVKKTSS